MSGDFVQAPAATVLIRPSSRPRLPMEVPTIELAGGSVRCMIAGVHLRPRPPGPADEPPAALPAHVLAGSR